MTVRQNVGLPDQCIARSRVQEARRKVDEGAGIGRPLGICRPAGWWRVGWSDAACRTGAQHRLSADSCCCSTSRCSNLDAKLRLRLRDDLRVILKQTGMTALYVTHDQAEAGGARRPHRGDARRQAAADGHTGPDVTIGRPTCSSRISTGATNELAGTLVGRNGEFGVIDFGRVGEARRAAARAQSR